jgi:hypothetical protein
MRPSSATESGGPALRRARREEGYALVAAVTSVLAFAYIAFQVLAADEGGIGAVSARITQAKLSAAADAGIYFAVHALANPDRGARWSLDGRPHDLDYAGDAVTIVLEDERGKAPLSGLNDSQARALFAGGGATGERLDALVTEFHSWQTEDEATADAPVAASGQPVRHGSFRTVGELIDLKDMDPALLARIAPAVTTFFEETGPFTPEHATPLAVAAMNADIEEAEGSDQQGGLTPTSQTAEELGPDDNLQGHTVTVRVTARDHSGARTHRMAIVELTGDPQRPFWVRYVE